MSIKALVTKDDLADLCHDIRKAKTDVIKWMFILWIAQIGATLVIVLLLRK
jgi:hypothetical protein